MSVRITFDPGLVATLNSFEDFVFLLDQNGSIVFSNNTVLRKLGYNEHELTGMNVLQVHPEEQRNQAAIIVQNMLLGTEDVCPIPLSTKTGEKIPVETKVSKIILNGESYILGISRDTTAWIRANQQLAQSEEKFKKSFELSTRMMAISDFETGKYIDVNELFLETTGFARDEVIGKTSIELGLYPAKVRQSILKKLHTHGFVKGKEINLCFSKKNKTIDSLFDAVLFESNECRYMFSVAEDITDKKKNAMALASSEEQLNLVIEGSNDGFWDWNIQTGKGEFSSRWAEMIGYKPEEIEYDVKFWKDSIHPDDKPYVFEELDKHQQGITERYSTEHRLKCKDGSYVWILDRGKIVEWDQENRPLRMVGTHSDITDKKLAEKKLQYRESFEKLINENSSALINIPYTAIDEQIEIMLFKIGEFIGVDRSYVFLLDPSETEMSNSHEWTRNNISPQKENLQHIPVSLLPWWMEKISTKQVINILNIALLPAEASAEKEILESQDIKSLIVVPLINQLKVTGFIGFDSVTSYHRWDSDTELLLKNAAIIIVNALQRKENESYIATYKNQLEIVVAERTKDLELSKNTLNKTLWELAQQNQELIKFKTIADKANYPIVILSSDELILYSNSKFSEITGWSGQDNQQFDFTRQFVDSDGPNFAKFSKLIKQRDDINSLEIIIRSLLGGKIPALVNASAIRDKNFDFLFFVLSFYDLTERKKSEQVLQQSDKLLALGTLAGGIAHDFNNILQIVQVYTELIEYQAIDKTGVDDNIKEIFNACKRGKSLVNNILNFSRQEVNTMLPYSFDFLVKEIVQIVRPLYPRTVEIVNNIEQVGMVSCDPVQIQQIIFNLFNNAMDAMKGKGIITVELRKLDASEIQSPHNVLLKISDNGKGMKKEVLNRVFDPFFTTKGVGEGTGLGLSTVLGIVKRHNAIIKIDSQAGKGTAIMILFLSQ